MGVHRGCYPLLWVLICVCAAAAPPGPAKAPITQLPLSLVPVAGFVENRGQFDPAVKFQLKTPTGALWVTGKGLVFDIASGSEADTARPSDSKRDGTNAIHRFVFAADFGDADLSNFEAKDPLPGMHNFLAADPAKSETGVRGYKQIVAHGIWPGIDLKLFVNGAGIEQEFVLQAGHSLVADRWRPLIGCFRSWVTFRFRRSDISAIMTGYEWRRVKLPGDGKGVVGSLRGT